MKNPYQLLREAREPLKARPWNIQKLDSEYVRCGTCSIFILTESIANYRHISVRQHHTKGDWAEEIRYLLTEIYPEHVKIILVMDNLNTHTKASLYQNFPVEEAAALANRHEINSLQKSN